MIMIVKTPGSQMGSPTPEGGGGEARGGGRGESGEWREKWSASGFNVGVNSAKSETKVERS